MRADDVGELGGIGDEIAPAFAHTHLRQVLQDVKTHAFKHDGAGLFDVLQIAQLFGGAFDAVAGGDEQLTALRHLAAFEQRGQCFHFKQRLLRAGEYHQVQRIVLLVVAGINAFKVAVADGHHFPGLAPAEGRFQRRRFRRHADHVEHAHRAVTRQRGAELF